MNDFAIDFVDDYAVRLAVLTHDRCRFTFTRFGFSPLYLSFAEIDRAADALVEILSTRSWDDPRFTERRRVT